MTNREKSSELWNLIQNIDIALDELAGFEEYRERLEELKFDVMEEQKEYGEIADEEELIESIKEMREREREYRSIQGF